MDKMNDFRGQWRLRGGGYAIIMRPKLDVKGNVLAWIGNLFNSEGIRCLGLESWSPNGTHDYDNLDLIERRRGNENG
jgi:hypothetical protein